MPKPLLFVGEDSAAMEVIDLLRRLGAMPRNEIAEHLGYSRSKATVTVNNLLAAQVVLETGDGDSSGGRRPRVIDFSPDFAYVIGVDMGATSIDIALANFQGKILKRYSQAIDVHQGPDEIMPLIISQTKRMAAEQGIPVERILAFGMGVPAPIEYATGIVVRASNVRGWDNYSIPETIQAYFPHAMVRVDNDANMMALGELRFGAGKPHKHFILVKVGTGIGAGVVINGKIYHGSNGSAGDIGHISIDRQGEVCACGNTGCLEVMSAGPAITRRALKAVEAGRSPIMQHLLASTGSLSPKEVGMAAFQGDSAAIEIIQESGRLVGEALSNIVNFFNPSLIIISGGVSQIHPLFLVSIRRAILKHSLPLSTRYLTVDLSHIAADVGVYGAIALALDVLFEQELRLG
jgi:glucokinase-like ROK family protein